MRGREGKVRKTFITLKYVPITQETTTMEESSKSLKKYLFLLGNTLICLLAES